MHINFEQLSSETDLVDAGNEINMKINIYALDESIVLKNGNYILNMDSLSSGRGGTHWVSFVCHGKMIFYFDSFGLATPQTTLKIFDKYDKIVYYNARQVQHETSIMCGWFAVAFIHYMNTHGKTKKSFNHFIDLFSDNLKKNDAIIKRYIKQIL